MFLTHSHSENKQSVIVWFWESENRCHFYMQQRLPRLKMEAFGWGGGHSPSEMNESVCKRLTYARLPPFLWLPLPPTPLPLAATTLTVSLALWSYQTSSDFIWPLLANQRPTSGWFPWQLRGPNILYKVGWGLVGGGVGGFRNALRLTALTDRAVQRPKWRYTATASSMCVGVYVLPHFPWVHCPSHGPSGKGWSGGLFVSLCMRWEECRDIEGAIF